MPHGATITEIRLPPGGDGADRRGVHRAVGAAAPSARCSGMDPECRPRAGHRAIRRSPNRRQFGPKPACCRRRCASTGSRWAARDTAPTTALSSARPCASPPATACRRCSTTPCPNRMGLMAGRMTAATIRMASTSPICTRMAYGSHPPATPTTCSSPSGRATSSSTTT